MHSGSVFKVLYEPTLMCFAVIVGLVGDRIIQLEPFATALGVHVIAITGLVGAVLFLGRPERRMLTPVYELDSSEM